MSEWNPLDTCPEMDFWVLACKYDAVLNGFTAHVIGPCLKLEGVIKAHSPFPSVDWTIDLLKEGYQPIRWVASPRPPADLCDETGVMPIIRDLNLLRASA